MATRSKKSNRIEPLEQDSGTYDYDEGRNSADLEPEGEWRPYVPLQKRRMMAAAEAKRLHEEGLILEPVRAKGQVLVKSPWGRAWCKNLESFADFASRLPAGRTYLRNESVIHLRESAGTVQALVQGSELYDIRICIEPLKPAAWIDLKNQCRGRIGSLVELLGGALDQEVMDLMARTESGLFPRPEEISFRCTCPDWAKLCKHVAASLYGIGHRLDRQPELLFALRGVNPGDLVEDVAEKLVHEVDEGAEALWDDVDLSQLFGIDLVKTP